MGKTNRIVRWTVLTVVMAVLGAAIWKGPQAIAFCNGVRAYLYGYPLILSDATHRKMAAPGPWLIPGSKRSLGTAPTNQLYNAVEFPDYNFRDVVAPNTDTLYSLSWLDLTTEPMVLHTPDMHGRWLLMQVLDSWTNVIASLGTRVYGDAARDYAIVGPNWHGTLPAGMIRVDSPTNLTLIAGRTYTAGKADYATVHAVQAKYSLVPLSSFGKPYTPPAGATQADPAIDIQTPVVTQVSKLDTKQYFNRLAALMQGNPPAAADAPVVKTLAALNILPGQPFQYEALTVAQRKGLDTAVWFVKALFEARSSGTQSDLPLTEFEKKAFGYATALMNKVLLNTHNRWQVPLNLGTYDTHYPLRAIVSLVGFGANGPQDAVYPMTTVDNQGDRLNGEHSYVVHFAKDQIPPVHDFWSLTLYNEQGFLIKNPLDRYSIGDRDPMKRNADGSLDILVQHDSPGSQNESNWLPAPSNNFKLILRLYGPDASVLNGTWSPPSVQKAK